MRALNHPRCVSLFHASVIYLISLSSSDPIKVKRIWPFLYRDEQSGKVNNYPFFSVRTRIRFSADPTDSNSVGLNSFDRLVSLRFFLLPLPHTFFAPRKPFARKYLFFHPFAHFLTTRRFHNTGNDEPVYTAEIRIERYFGPVPSVSSLSRVHHYQHWPAFVYIVLVIYVPGTLY